MFCDGVVETIDELSVIVSSCRLSSVVAVGVWIVEVILASEEFVVDIVDSVLTLSVVTFPLCVEVVVDKSLLLVVPLKKDKWRYVRYNNLTGNP